VQEGIDVALHVGRPVDTVLTGQRIASARNVVLATPAYFARAGEPSTPADLAAHEAVVYAQRGGGADWTFRRDGAEVAVKLKSRLHVTAAEGLRAAVLANAGIAIASEWMFAPEIANGAVKAVLSDWQLPPTDLWAVFPAGPRPRRPALSPASSRK
jgi:DNA-binding transcriptional LysR family regulator